MRPAPTTKRSERRNGTTYQVTLAWACRNLLEIAVFSKYVLLSEKNAMEFAADRLIDALEIGVTLKKLTRLNR